MIKVYQFPLKYYLSDLSSNTQIDKSLLVGRDNEINELLDDLNNNNNKSITLLVGESGIGKSKLLDEFYRRIRYESQDRFFVGYYDKNKALIAESQSFTYPFNIVLASLIEDIKGSQQSEDKIDSTLNRLKSALLTFAKEEGMKMIEAIVEDAAKKTGFEQTLKVAKNFWKTFKAEKTSLMQAEDALAQHKEDDLRYYLGIFSSLADHFKERSFVLIFDQFESAGKSSIDFFLNFVKLMPYRFHIIVAFRTETGRWEYDITARNLFEETRDKLIYDLGGKELKLEGLSAEDIGKWIKYSRGFQLPLVPDLKRIRENSGGLPLLLDQWIKQSENLKDYEEIKRDQLCNQIIKEEKGLSSEDLVKLYKLAILLHPLKDEKLAKYLDMEKRIDLIRPFIKELIERGIFEKNSKWFRHELVQKCFEDDLDKEEKRRYHKDAANFYLDQFNKTKNINSKEIPFDIVIGCAYHLHKACMYKESYSHNINLARYTAEVGNVDLAEQCYIRAIEDASKLNSFEEMSKCQIDLIRTVYIPWGRYDDSLIRCYKLLKYYTAFTESRAIILLTLADIYYIKRKYDEALKRYDESLKAEVKSVKNQSTICEILRGKARILLHNEKYDEALKLVMVVISS